jgi:Fur family transcriptional regulator, peroxide stress response regulator
MNTRMPALQELKEKIAATGLKVTQQRLVILQSLYESDEHPSAERVFKHLSEENPSLSLGTVYKTLETLVEKAIIRKVYCADGIKRYDVHTEPHSHLHCNTSNRIIDFSDPKLEEMIMEYLRGKKIDNFEIQDIQLQIQGRIPKPENAVRVYE